MLTHQLIHYGDNAWLIELDSIADVIAAGQQLASTWPAGVTDVVAGMRTQTVVFDHRQQSAKFVRDWIVRRLASDNSSVAVAASPLVEIDVAYNGVDLQALAASLQMSVEDLIAAHLSCEWQVAFTGFSPGFAYLVSPDWNLNIPRLGTPRTEVPSGSVALAAEFSGIYPNASPGGWQLIGSTTVELWQPHLQPPALLAPGTRVQFVRRNG